MFTLGFIRLPILKNCRISAKILQFHCSIDFIGWYRLIDDRGQGKFSILSYMITAKKEARFTAV